MFEASLMNGQRILVTGGGTGLGRAMAERFLSLGADVAICGRRQSVCEETAAEWRQQFPGRRIDTFGVDIRIAQQVDEMVESLFQSGGLTGLVNNAAGNFVSPTEALSPRAFDAIANIVFHGSFYVTQAVGKRWVAQAKSGEWKQGDAFRSVMSIIVTWVDGSLFVLRQKAGHWQEVRCRSGLPPKDANAIAQMIKPFFSTATAETRVLFMADEPASEFSQEYLPQLENFHVTDLTEPNQLWTTLARH